MSEELKPCPFCGSGNIELHGMPAVMEAPDTAQCADCNACAEAGNWNTRVAIKAWQGEAVAWRMFDGEGGYLYTEDPETVREWAYYLGGPSEQYKTWIDSLYTAPPAAGVIVPHELLETLMGDNPMDAWDARKELRALLAQSQEVKS